MQKRIKNLDMFTQDHKQLFKIKRRRIQNFLKTRKRLKQKLFRLKSSGRPYKEYKFLMSNAYSHISITVRPNNVFCTVLKLRKKFDKKLSFKKNIALSKSAGNYDIKLSKKGLKSKTLSVILKFLKEIRSIKFSGSEFLVLSITAPIKLRKKIIQFLSKSLLRSLFLKRKVLLNVQSKKVFNGCTPSKQRRKKRKGFRVLK
jgi:hypothetical protein